MNSKNQLKKDTLSVCLYVFAMLCSWCSAFSWLNAFLIVCGGVWSVCLTGKRTTEDHGEPIESPLRGAAHKPVYVSV